MTEMVQTAQGALACRDLQEAGDLRGFWNQVDLLTAPGQKSSRYLVGFACSDRCLEMALRLRYEIFNIELNEGLPESHCTGLDRDEFDTQMTHLVMVERSTGAVVGTYRLQTVQWALAHSGIYSAREFDLAPLRPLFPRAVECGRACIALDHRSPATVLLLWAGIGAFMKIYEQRYLFGCCSLTSQDPDEGWRALRTLRAKGYVHPELWLRAMPEYTCGPAERESDPALKGELEKIPKLFNAYMRLGSKVISEPAIDREFGTVDFLVLLDGEKDVNYSSLNVLV